MDITEIYLTDFFLINFRYIHILFNSRGSKSRKILSVFRTSPGHVICFPHLHLLQTVRSVRAPLSVPFFFVALPLRRKSNGMGYFGLWEALPSPWWDFGKQPWLPLSRFTARWQVYQFEAHMECGNKESSRRCLIFLIPSELSWTSWLDLRETFISRLKTCFH